LSAGVDEARAMASMADSETRAMRTMIRADVAVARERVVAARSRLRTLRERVLPLATSTVEVSLASYGAGSRLALGGGSHADAAASAPRGSDGRG
jgi:outer membrane protein TolC